MKCPICGRQGSENLVIIADKKEFLYCSLEHAMIFLQELFRLGQVAWLKERNMCNSITIHFDYEEILE